MKTETFDDLVKIIAQLRDPIDGCPWDLEQTHESLLGYLDEESQEVREVIESDTLDYDHLCEELGDVLLQVLLHAQLASEEKKFSIDDVVDVLSRKLIRRHPHVFGDSDVTSVDDVKKQWERIKEEEKKDKQ